MPRQYLIVALSVWPGLPQIWSGQEALGLFLAILFSSTLNLAIVARWVWTEAFPSVWSDFFAILSTVSWLSSLAYTVWWIGFCHPDRHRQEIDRLFREAHEAYLQGRWTDSRRRIERILALDETDADALIQLGALYIRTQQPGKARLAFRQCLELKGGAKWRWEIQQSLRRLGEG